MASPAPSNRASRTWRVFRSLPLWAQILAWVIAWPLLGALLLVSDPAGASTGRKVGSAALLLVGLPLWVGVALGEPGGEPTVRVAEVPDAPDDVEQSTPDEPAKDDSDEADELDEAEEPAPGEAGEDEGADEGLESAQDGEGPESAEHDEPEPQADAAATWTVIHVVDGDTIDVRGPGGTEERVRIVGIDTPERGECGFDRATRAMAALVDGKQVELVAGARDDRDHYDRILRYVDVGGTDAGLTLIERGLAIARYDSRDGYGRHDREGAYVAADQAAEHVCAQSAPAPTPSPEPEPHPSGNPWGTESCHPGYDPCVPPLEETGDLNCPDIREHHPNGVRVDHSHGDPHGLDRDKDGHGCES